MDREEENMVSIRAEAEDLLKEVQEYLNGIVAVKDAGLEAEMFITSIIKHIRQSSLDEVIITGGMGDKSVLLLNLMKIPLDVDMMFVVNFACTVLDTTDLSRVESDDRKFVYLAEMSNKAGYFYLRFLREGSDLLRIFLIPGFPNSMYVVRDGKHYLTHEAFRDMATETYNAHIFKTGCGAYTKDDSIHGPANTIEVSGLDLLGMHISGYDIVPTIASTEIPRIALEFFSRERGSWPPRELLDEIYNSGCYFVPKGLLGSQSCHYEWQVSFAHSEKLLITKFDETMFCTYVLLKIMKHKILRHKRLGDFVTSFMLKTALFWTIENVCRYSNAECSIYTLLKGVIERLTKWFDKDFIPHYFVKDINIIEGHFKVEDRLDIVNFVQNKLDMFDLLVQDVSRFLISFVYDLYNNMGDIPESIDCSVLSRSIPMTQLKVVLSCCCCKEYDLEQCVDGLTDYLQKNENASVIFQKCLKMKALKLSLYQDGMDADLPNEEISRFQMMRECCLNEYIIIVCNCVELAVAYIYRRNLKVAVNILESLITCLTNTGSIKPIPDEIYKMVHSDFTSGLKAIRKHITLKGNVILSNVHVAKAEFGFIPNGLKVEMICYDIKDDDKIGTDILGIHPIVYSLYLLFLCYREMQENVKQLKALQRLKIVCENDTIDNKDVAWNILGYCYSEMNQAEDALKAYSRAWSNRVQFNDMMSRRPSGATMMFVAMLLKKQLP